METLSSSLNRFQVQACPGATGFGYDSIFNVNGPDLPSLHLSVSGLGQGFTVQIGLEPEPINLEPRVWDRSPKGEVPNS